MRKAASIARGASSETSEPSVELMSTLKLMSPSPIVTGSMSSRTWRTRSSRNAKRDLEVEAEPVQHRQRHRELHGGADEDADRVAVELVRRRVSTCCEPTRQARMTMFQTSGLSAGMVKWS